MERLDLAIALDAVRPWPDGAQLAFLMRERGRGTLAEDDATKGDQ
jgi:hypothetical protein